MIDELMRRLLRKKRPKRFSAWQIELTTRCPLECSMCIRAGTDNWQHQDMLLEDFKKILPYLNDVETVVLEGWGESLLHRNILDCVRLAKAEGPRVGFVTSGMGLTQERVSGLINAGVDFMGFSLAGTTPEVHDRIRKNSSLVEILQAITRLQEVKAAGKFETPKLHIVFLMLRDNVPEIAGLPRMAHELGIKEIVLLNIIQATSDWQDEQKVFSCAPGESPFDEMLERVTADAQMLGITLRRASHSASEVPVCDENPLRNLYIAASGEVSPCVYLFPPVASPFKRIFCGKEHWVERVSFGNIFTEDFDAIWNRGGYAHFRECFVHRRKVYQDRYGWLYGKGEIRKPEDGPLPDPPEPCSTCHKMLGV
jgi:MoaA/NifB/PqqE/SkfB family radical SAM enzyme